MKEHHCQSCKGTGSLMVNSRYLLKGGTLKTYYLCRDCNTTLKKKYRKTENGKKKTREAAYRSVSRLEYKRRARVLVGYHVAKGNIKKPDNCSQCEASGVEAHHDDYSYALDVRWLCRQCHADFHNSNVKQAASL